MEKHEDRHIVYIIVNNSLNMSAGKVAAQVGHVIGEIYEYIQSESSKTEKKNFEIWKNEAKTKIVLSASLDEFEEIKKTKKCFLIRDAGFTEIKPGSETVLAFLPMKKSNQLKELKKLKLYK